MNILKSTAGRSLLDNEVLLSAFFGNPQPFRRIKINGIKFGNAPRLKMDEHTELRFSEPSHAGVVLELGFELVNKYCLSGGEGHEGREDNKHKKDERFYVGGSSSQWIIVVFFSLKRNTEADRIVTG